MLEMLLAEGRCIVSLLGAKVFRSGGRQMKIRRSIILKGSVIGGIDTPLHKLTNPDVIKELIQFKFIKISAILLQ